ncbi:MAG: hypothetical protein CL944_00400 [Candidatus Diapherotrites archaeon]|uniref:Uncharacterized protein n=1 Tax=Candidatus Iainarchaeum sp. TaxID=3101447 RepID=A0A2D6LNZ7_9ARCH|nr:hypothetical protein [Candidatus Diapherotrites archaeon]
MALFKNFVRGLYFALLLLIILFVGDYIFPGRVYDTAFALSGILIIFIAVPLDVMFALHPNDDSEEEDSKEKEKLEGSPT